MKIFLLKVRENKGLSTRQLEEISGVSKTHISAIENGATIPTIDIMCKLAKALEVPVTDLFDCEN